MTGYEVLRQRLQRRYRLSEKEAERIIKSPSINKVLAVFAEEQDLVNKVRLDNLEFREHELQERQKSLDRYENEIRNREYKCRDAYSKVDEVKFEEMKRLEEIEATKAKLEEEHKALREVETAEARDRLRMFQIFKEAVNIETPQNNTAFIAGCAIILSGESFTLGQGFGVYDNESKARRK